MDIAFFKFIYSIDAFTSVYIGGGTPSLLPLSLIKELGFFICSQQSQVIDEFTIEANPQDITSEHLQTWQECGINRLSIGIQSLQDDVLKKEKRRGSRAESLKILELVSKEWKGVLSLDFIAGLKGQTCENLSADLHLALQFAPHHISLYELVPHYEQMNSSTSSDVDKEQKRKELLWECGEELLRNSGYVQYEVSNFSHKGAFECVHNKAYWKMRDYVGVGVAAVGTMRVSEAKWQELINIRGLHFDSTLGLQEEGAKVTAMQGIKAIRSSGIQDVPSYVARGNRQEVYEWEEVNGIELLKDALLMGFRLVEGVDDAEFTVNFGTSLFVLIPKTIAKWQSMALLSVNVLQDSVEDIVPNSSRKNARLALTKKGMMLLNSFLCDAFQEIDERG